MITDRDRIYQAAQKHLQKGQLERAIAEYQSLVQDDPSDLRALLKVGDLQLRLGNNAAATAAYQQVAEAYAKDGFFLKAVAVYKQIYNVEPESLPVNEALAALYGQLNLVGEALAQQRTLAVLYARQGREVDSLAAIQRVLDAGDTSDDALAHWAEMKAKLGDLPTAMQALEQRLQQHRNADQPARWAQVAERMLALDEQRAGLACQLAKHYMDAGDAHAALIKLRLAFQVTPQDSETLALLARAFEALGQGAKATAVLHELEQQAAQRGQSHVRLKVLQQIAALNPNDAAAQQAAEQLGDELQARRQRGTKRVAPPPAGQGEAGQAAQITDAAEVAKLVTEATIYHRYGLVRRAVEELQRILTALPSHTEVAQLHASYAAELAQLVAQSRQAAVAPGGEAGTEQAVAAADAAPTAAAAAGAPATDAAAAAAAPTAAKGGFFAADETDADAPPPAAPPRPAPTLIRGPEAAQDAVAAFAFGEDSLDVDALIAAAMPAEAGAAQDAATRTEETLEALRRGARPQSPANRAADPAAAGADAGDAGDSSSPETHYSLAVAYREMGLYDEALAELRSAGAGTGGFAPRYLAALCHLGADRPAEALAALQAAVATPDLRPEEKLRGHYLLGLTARLVGNENLAEEHLFAALAQQADFAPARALLSPRRAASAEADALQELLQGAPAAAASQGDAQAKPSAP